MNKQQTVTCDLCEDAVKVTPRTHGNTLLKLHQDTQKVELLSRACDLCEAAMKETPRRWSYYLAKKTPKGHQDTNNVELLPGLLSGILIVSLMNGE